MSKISMETYTSVKYTDKVHSDNEYAANVVGGKVLKAYFFPLLLIEKSPFPFVLLATLNEIFFLPPVHMKHPREHFSPLQDHKKSIIETYEIFPYPLLTLVVSPIVVQLKAHKQLE